MVSSLPAVLGSALASASSVGFSGSRSALPAPAVLLAVRSAVPSGVSVSVGCAHGVDHFFRAAFPSATVFRASSFGSGAWSFAVRSAALVQAVTSSSAPIWVSFPSSSCPPGLVPSGRSSHCFRGLGSGSWASLAFAVGSGVPSFVWLPSGVSVPPSWGFVSLGGGWYSSVI